MNAPKPIHVNVARAVVNIALALTFGWAIAHLLFGCAATTQPKQVGCDALRESVCDRQLACGNTQTDTTKQRDAARALCEQLTVVDCMADPSTLDTCLDAVNATCDSKPDACKAVLR